jgi:hypothetical protein
MRPTLVALLISDDAMHLCISITRSLYFYWPSGWKGLDSRDVPWTDDYAEVRRHSPRKTRAPRCHSPQCEAAVRWLRQDSQFIKALISCRTARK